MNNHVTTVNTSILQKVNISTNRSSWINYESLNSLYPLDGTRRCIACEGGDAQNGKTLATMGGNDLARWLAKAAMRCWVKLPHEQLKTVMNRTKRLDTQNQADIQAALSKYFASANTTTTLLETPAKTPPSPHKLRAKVNFITSSLMKNQTL